MKNTENAVVEDLVYLLESVVSEIDLLRFVQQHGPIPLSPDVPECLVDIDDCIERLADAAGTVREALGERGIAFDPAVMHPAEFARG